MRKGKSLMQIDEIEGYLLSLSKRLRGYHVSEKFIRSICGNINEQILSILFHWEDLSFRKGLLMIGAEEGLFYQPAAVKSDIRCFVVVAIRNSLLEIPFSCDFRKAGLSAAIEESCMRELTEEAILYFKKLNFAELSRRIRQNTEEPFRDVYLDITLKYPVAWTALQQLGMCQDSSVQYDKIAFSSVIGVDELTCTNGRTAQNDSSGTVVFSGISPTYDSSILHILKSLDCGELHCFYADNFKMVTRNFEKLLKTMEFVLRRDLPFATCNYYIENGYIEKRITLLKAAHTEREAADHIARNPGAGKKHKEILKSIKNTV